MKKIALRTLAIVLFISTTLSSCNNDDGGETVIVTTAYFSEVAGPITGAINEDITLTVKYIADNACGVLDRYDEIQSGNTKTVGVLVKYTGDNCGAVPTEVTSPYTFNVNVPGTYTFKFRKNASQFITHVVTVE